MSAALFYFSPSAGSAALAGFITEAYDVVTTGEGVANFLLSFLFSKANFEKFSSLTSEAAEVKAFT